jgi:hypothetical protein
MKKDRSLRRDILWVLWVFIIWAGCAKEENKLDKNTRQLIDNLARAEIITMDSLIKAACDSIYQMHYQHTVDSLYQMRRYEVENIR